MVNASCEFDVKDIVTRARKTAVQAAVGTLASVNLAALAGDFSTSKVQAVTLAVVTSAVAAGVSVVWNAVKQYQECLELRKGALPTMSVTAADILRFRNAQRYDERYDDDD